MPSDDTATCHDASQQQNPPKAIACEFCKATFPSRNLFFRHLRDTSSLCGVGEKQTIPTPTSELKRLARQRKRQDECSRRARPSQQKHQQNYPHQLWIGDLPLPWTRRKNNYQRLRALLPDCCHLQHVQRKAYKKNGVYVGYVVVAVRDDLDCLSVTTALHGVAVLPANVFDVRDLATNEDFRAFCALDIAVFSPRVQPYVSKQPNNQGPDKRPVSVQKAGVDPPLIDQLRPLTTLDLCKYAGISGEEDIPHSQALEAAVTKGRRILQTVLPEQQIPNNLSTRLVDILRNRVRWPVPNHRTRVASDHYLVLYSISSNGDDEYQELQAACRELMNWAAPDYHYTAIAVTHNFVGSPHTDDCDQTFQFAASFGNFDEGGELCVQGYNKKGEPTLYVINTQNRMARVDGRRPHWVRTWTPGRDRYSLIFYDTSRRNPTPVHPLGVILEDENRANQVSAMKDTT